MTVAKGSSPERFDRVPNEGIETKRGRGERRNGPHNLLRPPGGEDRNGYGHDEIPMECSSLDDRADDQRELRSRTQKGAMTAVVLNQMGSPYNGLDRGSI